MQLSVTIPQLFYDLIARAIPGFLFIFMLGLVLYGSGAEVILLSMLSASNPVTPLLLAVVGGLLSYLMGWVLHSFTFGSFRKKVSEKFDTKNEPSISEMYNRVRIEDETVGFRLLKLRAEAKMLETLRAGMLYVVLMAGVAWLLTALGALSLAGQSTVGWVLKLLTPAILAFAFGRLEPDAWLRYNGSVAGHYKILFDEKAAKDEKPRSGKLGHKQD